MPRGGAQVQQRHGTGPALPSAWARRRVIAETGAGQHGTATAMAAAVLGMSAEIYMGTRGRQAAADERVPHAPDGREGPRGGRRSPEPSRTPSTRRCAIGPRPSRHVLHVGHGRRTASLSHHGARFPEHHRTRRSRKQLKEQEGRLPDLLVACVGGGQQRHRHLPSVHRDKGVELLGAEAAGSGIAHAASIPAPFPPARSACCTAPSPICCRTRTA